MYKIKYDPQVLYNDSYEHFLVVESLILMRLCGWWDLWPLWVSHLLVLSMGNPRLLVSLDMCSNALQFIAQHSIMDDLGQTT